MSVPYFRKTPCTFYFIIAAIHECGQFMTALGPRVIAAYLDVDMTRTSVVWCKLRYFLLSSFSEIPLICACLSTIDQFLITSQHVRFRQWSSIKNAYRVSLSVVIIWWLHGTLWLFYQNMSPITGVCIYTNDVFYAYTGFFLGIVLWGTPIIIMTIFGILGYQNVKKTTVLARLRLSPFVIYNVYAIITVNVEKNADRKAKESLTSNITYLFCSIAYAGRFYLLMFSSLRFRRTVKDQILWWRRPRHIVPSPR
ncbi:unnamed protein product [Rotaria sp. Silwood2]|nr:unnamed protein product [Rotaria sp. Silwood2]CAF2578484.1 unnamed protein product [Rotaria sp. Silwood2]CAF2825464.1 unnamed protein product [Rotaria sp. Silwood2]CAF4058810.1 unnamed protein product [Rotaria sp. Silwood2]CAF4154926.1 unnamed protein product [Rotaria sp. Silwood2]